jgi:hypothetical protein
MPANPPAPDSPEARRTANKVRSLFLGVAAANILLFAIVLWHRHTTKSNGGVRIEGVVAGMEAVFDRALSAYNSRDADAFLSSFSAQSNPQADRTFFATTILGTYDREFGRVTASKLIPSMTEIHPVGGTLVYEIRCEKRMQARLVAKFILEADAAKLTEWRIEPR